VPTADQIRAQLERILGSAGFASSERLRRFLKYVVERALAGEAGQLKEYVIGREVFDRDDHYDPRIDSIVRVEAGRLRTKIDEYYNGTGRGDDVVIRLQRGRYAPVFEVRVAAPAAQPVDAAAAKPEAVEQPVPRPAPWRLRIGMLAAALVVAAVVAWRVGIWATPVRPVPEHSIAVLPFSSYASDPGEERLAARLTDGVTGELAKLGTVGVVSHTSAMQFAGARRPIREIAKTLDADYILEGSILRNAAGLRVQVRLVDASTDRKIWVEDFEGQAADTTQLQRRVAQATSAAIPRTGK
jgi:TolB-like protein